jgi:molecular chaperone HtpG
MTDSAGAETFGFQAEVKQLLHLMVHSLYSNREIFLRELISNASDANDKLRFESLARPEIAAKDAQLEIRIVLDAEGRTLGVVDSGIGMNRAEAAEHLGTIAHSGTGRYLDRLTGDQKKDSQLIGQFGVGFYSAFIVADEVSVATRRADGTPDEGVVWKSNGEGEYTLAPLELQARGTRVTLAIKEDAGEFLDEHRIRGLIRKYSDHVAFPIYLDLAGVEPSSEPVNQAKALWTRPKSDIGEEEYFEFYRHITHDFSEPSCYSHNRVEGVRDYTSLLYIPSTAPFDLWNREAPRGVKLYVQRVFITDRAAEFLPLYLRFVRGVVDSADLSLNVSRELLQQDPSVASMRAVLTKRVLEMLAKLAKNDNDKFEKFWAQFGLTLKEGLAEDPANKDKIAKLLRFSSTRSAGSEQDRTLENYVADAGPGQSKIYYLVAESLAAAASSPQLEIFRERDIEVLLLTDRVDEWMVQYLPEFDGKALKDVARGELDLPDGDEPSVVPAEPDKDERDLLKRIKRSLRDEVNEVRESARLKTSASCIVLAEDDIGFQMREMLKAAGQDIPDSKPNLEVNLRHPLLARLAIEKEPEKFDRLSSLLFDQAILAEGRALKDPGGFVKRMNEVLFSE